MSGRRTSLTDADRFELNYFGPYWRGHEKNIDRMVYPDLNDVQSRQTLEQWRAEVALHKASLEETTMPKQSHASVMEGRLKSRPRTRKPREKASTVDIGSMQSTCTPPPDPWLTYPHRISEWEPCEWAQNYPTKDLLHGVLQSLASTPLFLYCFVCSYLTQKLQHKPVFISSNCTMYRIMSFTHAETDGYTVICSDMAGQLHKHHNIVGRMLPYVQFGDAWRYISVNLVKRYHASDTIRYKCQVDAFNGDYTLQQIIPTDCSVASIMEWLMEKHGPMMVCTVDDEQDLRNLLCDMIANTIGFQSMLPYLCPLQADQAEAEDELQLPPASPLLPGCMFLFDETEQLTLL